MQENSGTVRRDMCGNGRRRLQVTLSGRIRIPCLLALTLSLLLPLPSGNGATPGDAPAVATVTAPPLFAPSLEFDKLNTLIRDRQIPKEEARRTLSLLLHRIKEEYYRDGGKTFSRSDWIFPLRGYTAAAVGEGPAHGYIPKGYDYYDGNRHNGHPSLDIFIHDSNQDDLDDRTGEYVSVRAVTGGVVVARETSWRKGSKLRGGKYLWLYDPTTDHLFYYAHLRELSVQVGTRVEPGAPLGLVGRTGLNANKTRSPTHLHLTCLSTATPGMRPENIHSDLLRAKNMK